MGEDKLRKRINIIFLYLSVSLFPLSFSPLFPFFNLHSLSLFFIFPPPIIFSPIFLFLSFFLSFSASFSVCISLSVCELSFNEPLVGQGGDETVDGRQGVLPDCRQGEPQETRQHTHFEFEQV